MSNHPVLEEEYILFWLVRFQVAISLSSCRLKNEKARGSRNVKKLRRFDSSETIRF
ncbi:predicted protein [Botrytis cinerea T4]|uniref:Uncharacterized protein n=1 Tax=Botryotinia fuckeliana (strain T4) TaxID=999810 RepID=G2Y664_BOTF4|nr:predicted protein [Botrytis cinerea T4]